MFVCIFVWKNSKLSFSGLKVWQNSSAASFSFSLYSSISVPFIHPTEKEVPEPSVHVPGPKGHKFLDSKELENIEDGRPHDTIVETVEKCRHDELGYAKGDHKTLHDDVWALFALFFVLLHFLCLLSFKSFRAYRQLVFQIFNLCVWCHFLLRANL